MILDWSLFVAHLADTWLQLQEWNEHLPNSSPWNDLRVEFLPHLSRLFCQLSSKIIRIQGDVYAWFFGRFNIDTWVWHTWSKSHIHETLEILLNDVTTACFKSYKLWFKELIVTFFYSEGGGYTKYLFFQDSIQEWSVNVIRCIGIPLWQHPSKNTRIKLRNAAGEYVSLYSTPNVCQ